jgi:YfiH family protein
MESFFTNRHGGFSHGDYASWNLASHVGDDPADVEQNRKKLREQVGNFAVMSQVHGDSVVVIERVPSEVPVADALITSNPDLALVVLVADCIPLLLQSEKMVAAVHVGRAGLMNSIALKTVAKMRALGAIKISGSIGPAICGSCYEVPQELHDQVVAKHPLASSKTRIGTPALDLPKGLVAALAVVDVPVVISAGCTLEDDSYFSFRRNKITGRQAGVIKL